MARRQGIPDVPRWIATLLGVAAGAAVGLVAILAFVEHVLPLFGGRDEMSKGIAGTLLLVYVGPIFVVAGGVVGFRIARKR